MKLRARTLGTVILALVMLSGLSTLGLSVLVYRGPEQQKQASAIARQFFHFVYQSSQAVSAISPSPTASGHAIK
ncbi:MAG: hypothetical protein WB696_29205 [Chthoniobacterales bacterium]